MVTLVFMSGHTLPLATQVTVHLELVPVLAVAVVPYHHLLAVIITVNQPTIVLAVTNALSITDFFLMIHSGMVSSVVVRAHAALVPTLHHGSV